MDGLFDSLGVLITPYINIIPRQNTVKVVNRLLDGDLHVQAIGGPAKLLKADIRVLTYEDKQRLEDAVATCSQVTIKERGTYWNCIFLGEELYWTKRAGVFRAEAEMAILTTGPLPS
jgi:hypothetical protein